MDARIKVEVLDLSDPAQIKRYENILNKYQITETQFGFMKDGTPKVVIYYAKDDD